MFRSVSLPFVRRDRRGREDELEEYNSIVTMFSHLKSSVFHRDPNYEMYRDVDRTELCPEDSFFKLDLETMDSVQVVSPFLHREVSENINTAVEDFGYISTNRTFVTYGIDAKYIKIFGERDSAERNWVKNIRLPRGSWLKPVYGYIDHKDYYAGINYEEKECKHYHVSVYYNFKNYPTIDLKVRYAGQLSNMIEYAKHGRMTSKELEKLVNKIEDFYKYQNEIRLYAALEYDSPIVNLANCPNTASLVFCNANNNCYVFEPKFLQFNRKHYRDYYLKGIINLSLPITGLQICHRFVAIKNDHSTMVFKFVNKDMNYSLSSRSSRQRPEQKTNYSLIYEREFKLSSAYERRLQLRMQRPEQQAQFEKIIMRPIFDHQNDIQAIILFTWRHEEITCVLFQLSNLNWFPISRLLLPADIEIYDCDISLDKDMIHLLTPSGMMTYCTHVHEFVKLFFDSDHPTTLLNLFYSKTMPYKRMYLISGQDWDDDSYNFVKIASSSSFFRFINRDGKIFQMNKPDQADIDVCLSLKHAEFSHKSRLVRRFFYRRATEPAYPGVPSANPMTDTFREDLLPGGTLQPLSWMPSNLWTSYYDPNLDEHYLSFALGIMLTSDQLALKDRKHIIYKYQECLDYFNSHFKI